jgi:adenylate cyclase
MATSRRLAAILAADVAGYSRLMGADEEGTHHRLQAHLRQLVDPKIGEHSGRVVKNTGDGMLAKFPSVVDAVRCGVELQRAIIDREAGTPEDRRIRFRIGINLGARKHALRRPAPRRYARRMTGPCCDPQTKGEKP